MYRAQWTNQARRDADTCIRAGYGKKLAEIIKTVKEDPFKPTQGFKRLYGDLRDFCSRKINRKNRFVYSVYPNIEHAKDETGYLYDGIVRVHKN